MSVEFDAAGIPDLHLIADKSGYSYVMRNNAMLGIPPEIIYTDGLAVDWVTFKFEIKDEFIPNELDLFGGEEPELMGIKRLNIFKFFEGPNLLLPIETKFDVANNVLYTEVDEFGTYCIMDMEKWFVMLGLEVDEDDDNSDDNSLISPASFGFAPLSVPVTVPKIDVYSDEPFNVVFVIDTRSIIDSEAFEYVKAEILAACADILMYSFGAKIYFMEQVTSPIEAPTFIGSTDEYGNPIDHFTNINKITSLLNAMTRKMEWFDGFDDICYVSDAITFIYENVDTDVQTFVFTMFSERSVYFRVSDAYDVLQELVDNNISVSVIADIDEKYVSGYVFDLVNGTGGVLIPVSSLVEEDDEDLDWLEELSGAWWDYSQTRTMSLDSNMMTKAKALNNMNIRELIQFNADVLAKIYGNNRRGFPVIMATGYQTIFLDGPLSPDSERDTDGDGITDWEEVNHSAIISISLANGITNADNARLPTINDCIIYMGSIIQRMTYVENGLARYKNDLSTVNGTDINSIFDTVRILPILSNPAAADSSNSGIPDKWNKTPLRRGGMNNVKDELWNENLNESLWNSKEAREGRYLFYVLEDYQKPIKGTISSRVINFSRTIPLYSIPYENDAFKMPRQNIYFRRNNPFSDIDIYGIVQSTDGQYWLLVSLYNRMVMGYIKYNNSNFNVRIHNTVINDDIRVIRTIPTNSSITKGATNKYAFTPTISGVYTFYTTSVLPVGVNQPDILTDTKGTLFNSNKERIASNDDIATNIQQQAYTEEKKENNWKNYNFSITAYLEADTIYYLEVGTGSAATARFNYTLNIKSYASPLGYGFFHGVDGKSPISTMISSEHGSGSPLTGIHNGIDIARNFEYNLFSITDGIVNRIGQRNNEVASGNFIEIKFRNIYGENQYILYMHLYSISPKIIDALNRNEKYIVRKGELIGTTGKSGSFIRRSDGVRVFYQPHLHLEILDKNRNIVNSPFYWFPFATYDDSVVYY
jgi:murein DD-endopeptidase MepM/ murein hydrolase activator NlpD